MTSSLPLLAGPDARLACLAQADPLAAQARMADELRELLASERGPCTGGR